MERVDALELQVMKLAHATGVMPSTSRAPDSLDGVTSGKFPSALYLFSALLPGASMSVSDESLSACFPCDSDSHAQTLTSRPSPRAF